MASKKQDAPGEGRTARGGEPRGPRQHTTAARARKQASDGIGSANQRPAQEAPAAPDGATQPPPGLDAARHARAQRTSHQAEVIRKGVFPSLMATALAFDNLFEAPAYKTVLEQVLREAGDPDDPVAVMMVQQLVLAHFRIAQLHASAGQAQGLEGIKILNSAAARMLGEFRRTALALRAYCGRVPEGRPEKDLKLFKAAQ